MALRKKGKPRGRPNPQNLKPWKKGIPSPNPGGRPKFAAISEAMRHILTLDAEARKNFVPDTLAEKIAMTRVEQSVLKSGLFEAQFVADRTEGKALATVRSSVDLTGAKVVIDIMNPTEEK